MNKVITSAATQPKQDAEPKAAPLFAQLMQAPKVRTGIRSGSRNAT